LWRTANWFGSKATRITRGIKADLVRAPDFITNADKMRVEIEDPNLFIYEKKLSGQCSRRVEPAEQMAPAPPAVGASEAFDRHWQM
jgi:hypothetical protein